METPCFRDNEDPRSPVPQSFGIIRGSLTKGQIISLTFKLSDLYEPPQNRQKSNKKVLSAFLSDFSGNQKDMTSLKLIKTF